MRATHPSKRIHVCRGRVWSGTANSIPHTDDRDDDTGELSDREGRKKSVVLGPDELDQEPFGTGKQEICAKQPTGPMNMRAKPPQRPENQQHRRGLVQLGRVHCQRFQRIDTFRNGYAVTGVQLHGGRWWQPLREPHAPRQARGNAVVILYQETPDTAQRVPDRQGRCDEVARDARGDAFPQSVQIHRGRSTDETTVPHQTTPRHESARIAGEDDVPDLGAYDSPDHGGDYDVRCVILVQTTPPKLSLDRPSAGEERHHHHQAVTRDLESKKIEDERVSGHS